jgi:hypothetical protein
MSRADEGCARERQQQQQQVQPDPVTLALRRRSPIHGLGLGHPFRDRMGTAQRWIE